jgi:hypothetical protein
MWENSRRDTLFTMNRAGSEKEVCSLRQVGNTEVNMTPVADATVPGNVEANHGATPSSLSTNGGGEVSTICGSMQEPVVAKAVPKKVKGGKKKRNKDSDDEESIARPKTKSKPGGGGDLKFRDEELQTLMDICDDILQVGKSKWEKVANRYNQAYPKRPRNEKALRNQFNSYANKKPPTGNPDCPHFVKLAKLIVKKTKQKAEVSCCDERLKELAENERPAIGGRGTSTQSTSSLNGNSSYKKRPAKDKKLTSTDVMKMMIVNERMQAKREQRFAIRQAEERQDNLRLALGAFGALATAFTGRPVDLSSLGGVPSAVMTTVGTTVADSLLDSSDEDSVAYYTPMGRKVKTTLSAKDNDDDSKAVNEDL